MSESTAGEPITLIEAQREFERLVRWERCVWALHEEIHRQCELVRRTLEFLRGAYSVAGAAGCQSNGPVAGAPGSERECEGRNE